MGLFISLFTDNGPGGYVVGFILAAWILQGLNEGRKHR